MLFTTLIQHIANDGDVKVKASKDRVSFGYNGPVTYDNKSWDGVILKVYVGSDEVIVKFARRLYMAEDYTPVSMEVIVPISGIEGFLMGILGLVEPKHAAPVEEPVFDVNERVVPYHDAIGRLLTYASSAGIWISRGVAEQIVADVNGSYDDRHAFDIISQYARQYGVTASPDQVNEVISIIRG